MVSRRQLLRGKLSNNRAEIFPPWSIETNLFLQKCTRCDACIKRCPQQILSRNNLGYPVVDFTQRGCTFCTECVDACSNGSLSLAEFIGTDPWTLKAFITEACVNFKGVVCHMCSGSCGENAIKFSVRHSATATPEIDWPSCTGCGECYRSCPQRAIQIKPQLTSASSPSNSTSS